MKKLTNILAMAVMVLGLVAGQAALAGPKEDMKAVKKADKVESTGEAKWFKVLVIDTKTNKEKVKITLPLSLVEVVAEATPDGCMHVGHGQDLDLKKIFAELKKIGPLAMIEVFEDDEHVKIWLE